MEHCGPEIKDNLLDILEKSIKGLKGPLLPAKAKGLTAIQFLKTFDDIYKGLAGSSLLPGGENGDGGCHGQVTEEIRQTVSATITVDATVSVGITEKITKTVDTTEKSKQSENGTKEEKGIEDTKGSRDSKSKTNEKQKTKTAEEGWLWGNMSGEANSSSIATEVCQSNNTDENSNVNTDQSRSDGSGVIKTFRLPGNKKVVENSKDVVQANRFMTSSSGSIAVRQWLIDIVRPKLDLQTNHREV